MSMSITEVELPRQSDVSDTLQATSPPSFDTTSSADDLELIAVVHSLPVGDSRREAACEELIRRYRPLVNSCAQYYAPSRDIVDDLVQTGYVGLLSAINNFNPDVGCSLPGYARPCILGEIKRYFRDKRWPIRMLRPAQELRAKVQRSEADLTQRLQRTPSDQEVADSLRLEVAEVREARRVDRAFHALSLEAPFSGAPDAGTLADMIGAEDAALQTAIDMDAVWEFLSALPHREQLILALRYYGNMTQAQIGERLGISQMHVSRLLAHALGYLRDCVLNPD